MRVNTYHTVTLTVD